MKTISKSPSFNLTYLKKTKHLVTQNKNEHCLEWI